MDPDSLRLAQLTKEMVAEELRRMGDPVEAAAAVLRKTLSAALTPENFATVIDDGVRGAMTALLLADLSVVKGALLCLAGAVEAAEGRGIEPAAARSAAVKALADLRRFIEPSRVEEIRRALDREREGDGAEFLRCLEAAPLPDWAKARRPK